MHKHDNSELHTLWQKDTINVGNRDRAKDVAMLSMAIPEDVLGSSAVYASERTGEAYSATLFSCTCESFAFGRTPCKHMIHLALASKFLTQNDLPDDQPAAVGQAFKKIPKTEDELTLFRISTALKVMLIEGFKEEGVRILPERDEDEFMVQLISLNQNGGLIKNFKSLSPLFKMSFNDFAKKYACKPDNALKALLNYEDD